MSGAPGNARGLSDAEGRWRLVVLGAVLFGLLSWPLPAVASAPVAGPVLRAAALDDACQRLAALNSAGRSEEVIALIAKLPAGDQRAPCVLEQHRVAVGALAAEQAVPTTSPAVPSLDDACEEFAALNSAGRSEEVIALIAKLPDDDQEAPCVLEQHRVAVGALAAAEQPSSGVEELDEDVATTVSEFLAPLGRLALGLLALLLAFVVVARLLTLLPVLTLRRVRWSMAWRRLFTLIACVGLPAVAVGWLWWLSEYTTAQGNWGWAELLAGASLVLLLLAAHLWATALRIRIDVMGASSIDEIATGHLAALLQELGADEPDDHGRALEIPRGADVEALKGVGLASAPSGKLLGAVYGLVELLLPRSPWYVRAEHGTDGSLSVSVSRNRRIEASALIDTSILGAPDSGEGKDARYDGDVFRLAAALILLTLSRSYRGFDFLYGAEHWRSLGLQSIATMDYPEGSAKQKQLLAQAVELDAGNFGAHAALWHALYRNSSEQSQIDDYVRLLDDVLPTVRAKRWVPLELRLAYVRCVMRANGTTAPDDVRRGAEELDRRLKARRCRKLVVGKRLQRRLEPLLMAARAAAPNVQLEAPPGFFARVWTAVTGRWADVPQAGETVDQTTRYNKACRLAAEAKAAPVAGQAAILDKAMRELTIASVSPHLRDWMLEDPVLVWFWRRESARSLFSKVAGTPFDLAPIGPYKKALATIGITDPLSLARVGVPEPWKLARLLKVDPLVAQSLARLLSGIRAVVATNEREGVVEQGVLTEVIRALLVLALPPAPAGWSPTAAELEALRTELGNAFEDPPGTDILERLFA